MNWSELIMSKQIKSSPAFSSLRPGNPDVLQYDDAGHNLLAVKSTAPYGVLSGQLGEHFLPVVTRKSDHTLLELPEEVLSLSALTLGTGYKRHELLGETYKSVGRAVSQVLITNGVTADKLTLDDVAVERTTGKVLFIPPIDFHAGDSANAVQSLTDSIGGLSGTFNAGRIQSLKDSFNTGVENV